MLGAATFGGPTVGIFLLVIVALVMIGFYLGVPTRWFKPHSGRGFKNPIRRGEHPPRPR